MIEWIYLFTYFHFENTDVKDSETRNTRQITF